MTKEEHQKRHIELHKMLDELATDWAVATGGLFSKSSILDLMVWSNKQSLHVDHDDPTMS